MSHSKQIVALDIGERRIGVAQADTATRFPVPLTTIAVDGLEFDRLREIITELQASIIVIGLPRNQEGAETKQSKASRAFAKKLSELNIPIVFQDESLTSVLAENYLKSKGKPYTKEDIDAHAAAIVLGDYLES